MNSNKKTGSFIVSPGYCPDCGTILPLCPEFGDVTCRSCETTWDAEIGLYFEVNFTKH